MIMEYIALHSIMVKGKCKGIYCYVRNTNVEPVKELSWCTIIGDLRKNPV